jgi:putative acetyltransferase
MLYATTPKPLPLTLHSSSTQAAFTLRPIEPKDDVAVQRIIVETLAEFGYSEDSPATDPEVAHMSRYIASHPKAKYFVIEEQATGRIVGCGGLEPLKGDLTASQAPVAELIKFYCEFPYRNQGLGGALLEQAIAEATALGFETLYYEVTPTLFSKSLFVRLGFYFIDAKLGSNGHTHPEINIFVLKPLREGAKLPLAPAAQAYVG